jgi:hypothetical protein
MSHIAANYGHYIGKKYDNGCGVQFVKQIAHLPAPATWRAGKKVQGADATAIAPGTAIATFVDNHFPGYEALGYHAAVYMSHDGHGIRVVDQRPGHHVSERVISFDGNAKTQDNGSIYYVIE